MVRNTNKESNSYELLVGIDRVSKVTKGGRNFAYRVIILVGNGNGYIGCGIATHAEVAEAKIKATKNAKSKLNGMHISLYEGRTINHEVWGKFNSTKVFLKPAVAGTGVIAGGAVRKVCSIIGITDIIAKSYYSSKSHNVINAVFNALSNLYSIKFVANKRGKSLNEIVEQRV
ncbi:MAG: 30S ribosomal protein S5 [Rickettsiaceae bacterium H1]|nr:30S ribosomal protein S5 [Rickettsiaceae bacterium H1]